MLHAVIMAGGSGTRFWPLSRQALPKQFLRLASERSLIQQAWDRAAGLVSAERIWIVAGRSHRDLILEHLPSLPEEQLLLEPSARNTASAIGWAATRLREADTDAAMLVMPADHLIEPHEAFHRTVRQAEEVLKRDAQQLVLFGVRPTFAATGYGYIEVGDSLSAGSPAACVASFREKPDEPTAQGYVKSGRFLWNSGIFVWQAERILAALAEHEPELAAGLSRLTGQMGHEFEKQWNIIKSISIDYAVLERDAKVCVIPAGFEWDDVGSWESLARRLKADANGNVVISGECLSRETANSIVHAADHHVIVTSGIEDCLVIHTPTVTLVARRSDAEAMRNVIEFLKSEGRDDLL